jgi:hypothetical protein
MKQIVAIILLSLFFLQAVPVVRLLCAAKNAMYSTVIAEDTPDETKGKEKKESKEYLAVPAIAVQRNSQPVQYYSPFVHALPSPYLESFTPPPNCIC